MPTPGRGFSLPWLRGHRRPTGSSWACHAALQAHGASFKATQVVVQRLDVGEDTHGVWLAAHHHHILHLDQALAVGQVPETQKPHQKAGPGPQSLVPVLGPGQSPTPVVSPQESGTQPGAGPPQENLGGHFS